MTPAAVEERYGVPPARYPELAALVGETSDNLPGVPGVGQGFAAKWINQYDGLDNVIAHADEITGKKGEALREHLGDVIRNRRLNALVCDLELEARPGRPRVALLRPAGRAHPLRRARVPVLRTRLLEAIPTEEEARSTSPASTSRCGVLEDRRARRLAGRARRATGDRVGVHPVGHWRAGTGDVTALAFATEDGAAYVSTDRLDPADEEALATWLRRPGAAQGAARRQGADARPRRPRHAAGRARARHRAVGLPRPARPALLRPRRPDGPLPQARAQAGRRRGGRRGPARASTWATPTRTPAGDRDAARAGGARPGRGARRRARGARRHPAAHRDRAAAGRPAGPDGADRHRRRRRPPPVASRPTSPAEVKLAAEEAFAVIGKEINLGSPKQLQVVLFDELGDAQDQAHQDRLHHRRRRAAGSSTSRPSTRSCCTCCGTATCPGCGRPSRACSRRSRPTAGSARRSTS